jgi:hypothetical protein
MTDDHDDYEDWVLVDSLRSAPLHDVGMPGYRAATGLDSDGDEYLSLVEIARLGRDGARFDIACADVAHEQVGPLPLEYVRRVTVAARVNRCGRLTQAGRPCRIRVAVVGAACEWHRSRADA